MSDRDAIAKDQIRTHEGTVTEVYLDSLGNPTCGVGHHLYIGSYVPLEVVDAFFDDDYKEALKNYKAYRFKDVNMARRTALIDMMFNLGKSRFLGFKKMITAIKNDDWQEAAEQAKDSRWYHQVGRRSRTIVEQLRG